MKTITPKLISIAALILFVQTAQASDVVVIANAGVSLSASEVRDVFWEINNFRATPSSSPWTTPPHKKISYPMCCKYRAPNTPAHGRKKRSAMA